ncbi:M14/M99 family metallopeptidase [Candidatus Latescibacterota bacterium]
MIVLAFLFCIYFLSPITVPLLAETRVETYFENTDHKLTVYYIEGKEAGNTMMIIGGIQGDEPGGYLAADLYPDLVLEKGNLIVVPRANFYSIKKNIRGVNGDMNRKFAPKTLLKTDYDSQIVEILKILMSRSDVLLNLHEGSGYYFPEYISGMKNPMRYGQCIIIDAPTYNYPDGKIVDLENPARNVVEEMNRYIKNPDHKFHLNNHDTFSDNSEHKEQRGSATYNAVTLFGIPGYGIETSKDIKSIETRVKHETLAINAFMREYGIVLEHPSIYLPTPELDHLVVTIKDSPNPFAVMNGAVLSVPAGAPIKISSIVANYKRGLLVDILGYGNSNDLGRATVISSPTKIRVYKDAYLCGEVLVEVTHSGNPSVHLHPPALLEKIEIKIHDKNYVVSVGDTLHIVRGDIIKLVDAWTANRSDTDFRINFLGFVGNKSFNDAEDRGYDINTSHDLIKRYDLNGSGLYRIETLKGKESIGSIYISLEEPEIHYLIVEHMDGSKDAITPGSVVRYDRYDKIKILSIVSNVTSKPFINTFLSNGHDQPQKLVLPTILEIPLNSTLLFKRTSHNLGSISFEMPG